MEDSGLGPVDLWPQSLTNIRKYLSELALRSSRLVGPRSCHAL